MGCLQQLLGRGLLLKFDTHKKFTLKASSSFNNVLSDGRLADTDRTQTENLCTAIKKLKLRA
jgi:hypothetical protein